MAEPHLIIIDEVGELDQPKFEEQLKEMAVRRPDRVIIGICTLGAAMEALRDRAEAARERTMELKETIQTLNVRSVREFEGNPIWTGRARARRR